MGNGYQKVSLDEENKKEIISPNNIILDDEGFSIISTLDEINDHKVQVSNTIQSFRELTNLVKTINTKQELLLLMKNCDPNAILDWYDTNLFLLWKKDEKATMLAEVMPVNTRFYMWRLLENYAPINIMKILSNKIKLDITNVNTETFLYYIPQDPNQLIQHIEYLIDLINNINILPLDHTTTLDKSFLIHLCSIPTLWTFVPKEKLLRLFEALAKRNFKFKIRSQSILSYLLSREPKYAQYYYILVNITTHNITSDCEWLLILLRHHIFRDVHNYLYKILERSDYSSFLYRIYINDRSYVWGKEYLDLLTKLITIDPLKTKHMLQYSDSEGFTVIDIMGSYHDKELLYPILTRIDHKLLPDIRRPIDLYYSSKLVQ